MIVSDSSANIPFASVSTAPQPGTSAQGGGWDDFINTVVNGVNSVIRTAQNPNQGGWGGTNVTLPANGAAGSSSGLGWLLLVGLLFLIAEG